MHLNLDDAVSAARFTPAALYVKAEPSLAVPLCLGVRSGGEQVPYEVEYACVGSRVGPGSTPDGRLVDVDNLIQLLHALDALVPARYGSGPVQLPCQGFINDFIHKGTFAGTGHAGHTCHDSQGNVHIDVL